MESSSFANRRSWDLWASQVDALLSGEPTFQELGEDGHDLACDAERGEDFHWREARRWLGPGRLIDIKQCSVRATL